MSGPITLTFIGGPEDGKRVALKSLPGRQYRVAVLPKLPTYFNIDEPNPADSLTLEQFVYEIEKLPGENFVAYPQVWQDDARSWPTAKIVTALLRGYIGRGL